MLVRWNPFRELSSFQDEMNRLFDSLFKKLPTETVQTWYPVVDIIEDDGNYVLKAELPGLSKDDIELHIENRVLTLKGERKMDKEVKERSFRQIERSYGKFLRTFTLPTAVVEDKITANFKDGLLEVVIPKADEIKPRTIVVNAAV
jgi:HSP20 family protein